MLVNWLTNSDLQSCTSPPPTATKTRFVNTCSTFTTPPRIYQRTLCCSVMSHSRRRQHLIGLSVGTLTWRHEIHARRGDAILSSVPEVRNVRREKVCRLRWHFLLLVIKRNSCVFFKVFFSGQSTHLRLFGWRIRKKLVFAFASWRQLRSLTMPAVS